jgi:hypothetical protein
LPSFVRRKGPHQPSFRKENKATNQFTEATLLRAMETAGKQVDDEDLRIDEKKNGMDVHPREPILLKPFQTPIYQETKNRFCQRQLVFN